MVQEARQHESEDKKRRELIDARNTADSLVYQTEKALRDLGDKVSGPDAQDIQSKIDDLKSAAQGDDLNRIKRASEQVQQAFHALSQQLYAQGAQGQPHPETPGGPSPRPNGEDVIEGEVKE